MSKNTKQQNNYAFIDGQNLHLGTFGSSSNGWKIDYKRLRTYLYEKYGVTEAYYFLGFVSDEEQDLYTNLQKAGFILEFREHSSLLKGKKKGNVDCGIVFAMMRKYIEDDVDKIFLISGDGDYIKVVDYLVKKGKFGKILFPNTKFASSLYKKIGGTFYDSLDKKEVRNKIQYRNKKGP